MRRYMAYGAGVQTTAMLVLLRQDRYPGERPEYLVFSDTGGEYPETYDYLWNVAIPYAKAHELPPILVLGPEWRAGYYRETLEEHSLKHRIVPNVFFRWCTVRFKVHPLHRWAKQTLGASTKAPVEVHVGISTDEAHRATPSSEATEVKRYPLLEAGLSREDCGRIITEAGLPLPRKSGCFYCPFQKQAQWQAQKRLYPGLFERSLAMERVAIRHKNGTPRYLPMFGSLERVAAQDELPGFDEAIAAEGGCVGGACHV